MIVAVGSTNPAKVSAAKIGFGKVFPNDKIKVVGTDVKSGVSDQPMSDKEAIKGAINRAKAAFKSAKNADYGVGMEGGLHQIGKNWFESGWIAVINKEGKMGLGTCARWQVSNKVIGKLAEKGELGNIFEELANVKTAKDIGGVHSIITNQNLTRNVTYSHGVIFALAPFFSDPQFWD